MQKITGLGRLSPARTGSPHSRLLPFYWLVFSDPPPPRVPHRLRSALLDLKWPGGPLGRKANTEPGGVCIVSAAEERLPSRGARTQSRRRGRGASSSGTRARGPAPCCGAQRHARRLRRPRRPVASASRPMRLQERKAVTNETLGGSGWPTNRDAWYPDMIAASATPL